MVQTKLSARLNATASTPTEGWLPYLGQTPPGNTPLIFAEGVISTGNVHGQLVISPDGKEMFWTTFTPLSEGMDVKIMHMIDNHGKWTDPQFPPFLANGMSSGCVFSPGGRKLFFGYTEDIAQGWKTHYVAKTASGWSQPKNDGFLLNPSASFTRSGMVYFSSALAGKPWNRGIFSARYSVTGFTDIQALDAAINSYYIDYTPFVSPEGDYLMFSSSRPTMDEEMFLHISFKNEDGTWSNPQKMNEKMGFSGQARFPSISPDGQYIFFCGDDGNIYWVSRAIVSQFKL
jgi:hypothetical protein